MKVATLFTGIGGLDLGCARATSRAFDSTTAHFQELPNSVSDSRAALRAPRTALTSAAFLIEPRDRLEQAGHEIIFQVEHDERCAQVLRTQFPRARLDRHLHSVRELPAETEVLAATLHWPEEGDDDAKERAAVEQSWLPASRAAALEEHAQVFRLLGTRPVSWVVLELPVSLLRWATAAVPGAREKTFSAREARFAALARGDPRASARDALRRIFLFSRPLAIAPTAARGLRR